MEREYSEWCARTPSYAIQLADRPEDLARAHQAYMFEPKCEHMIGDFGTHVLFHATLGNKRYCVEIGFCSQDGEEQFDFTAETAMRGGWGPWTGFNINSFRELREPCAQCLANASMLPNAFQMTLSNEQLRSCIECQLESRPETRRLALKAFDAGTPRDVCVVDSKHTPLRIMFTAGSDRYRLESGFHWFSDEERGNLTHDDVARGGWDFWVAFCIASIAVVGDDEISNPLANLTIK